MTESEQRYMHRMECPHLGIDEHCYLHSQKGINWHYSASCHANRQCEWMNKFKEK